MIRRVSLLAALTCAAGFALVAPAGAAVEIGQVASPGDMGSCGGAAMYLTPTVAAGSPSYQVPPGGGVLTQWSASGEAHNPSDDVLKLKVVNQIAPMTYRIVASDVERVVVATQLNTYSIRIPVSGGELLALWVPAGSSANCYIAAAGNILESGGGPEPNVGEDFVTNNAFPGQRTSVAALLEPDADNDGFGDETQDPCPGQTGTIDGCTNPAPPAAATSGPTGQRAAALKTCKKTAKKKGWTKKRLRKCKKKARLLPV